MCTYELVRPERTARTRELLEWLKANAEEKADDVAYLFDRPDLPDLDVYVADVDNDGSDEYVIAVYEGSGHYLFMRVFRRTATGWSLVSDSPLDDRMSGEHDYRGASMNESHLLARFCGKTYISFRGGIVPNYFPVTYVWEQGQARLVCDTPWLEYQRRVFQKLFDDQLFDEAHVLLDSVQALCAGTANR